MKKILIFTIFLFGSNLTFGQCPTSVVAVSSSEIQITFGTACSSGDPIGYVALYVSGFSGYRGYFASSSQLTNTSTTAVTIADLDSYGQNFTGNTTPWDSSDIATRIRTEDINFNSCHDCTNSFALPVNLFSFFGKSQQNVTRLFWETATEVNNEKFEIERSLNAKDFEKIGEVGGHGNSDVVNTYEFEDRNVQDLPEKVYYRLKQIDFDGSYEYSIIAQIRKDYNPYEDISLRYNSDQEVVRVVLNNPEFDRYQVDIIDLHGKSMIQSSTTDHYLDIGTANLPKGVYLVKISSDNSGDIYRKVIVQ